LKTVGKVVCAVLEEDNKAKREKDEKSDPKYPAQQRHGATLTEPEF
jgi:hypothetical protein